MLVGTYSALLVKLLLLFVLIIIPTSFFFSFLERKFSADFQARVGPKNVGGRGFFQPIADFFKSLNKIPKNQNRETGAYWLFAHSVTLFSTLAVIPLGSELLFFNTDMSIFIPFAASLAISLLCVFLGLSFSSVPEALSGIRSASLSLTGIFPALVTVLCVGVGSGGFRWSNLVSAQSFSPLQWAIFQNPFLFLAFLIFVASGHVLLSLAPLDGSFGSRDLCGGLEQAFAGKMGILFRLSRFYCFFLWSLLAVVLFLGAWNLPQFLESGLQEGGYFFFLQSVKLGLLILKTFTLMLIVVWISRSSPRPRIEQITDFSWKILAPFSIFSLVGTLLWVEGSGLL